MYTNYVLTVKRKNSIENYSVSARGELDALFELYKLCLKENIEGIFFPLDHDLIQEIDTNNLKVLNLSDGLMGLYVLEITFF